MQRQVSGATRSDSPAAINTQAAGKETKSTFRDATPWLSACLLLTTFPLRHRHRPPCRRHRRWFMIVLVSEVEQSRRWQQLRLGRLDKGGALSPRDWCWHLAVTGVKRVVRGVGRTSDQSGRRVWFLLMTCRIVSWPRQFWVSGTNTRIFQ